MMVPVRQSQRRTDCRQSSLLALMECRADLAFNTAASRHPSRQNGGRIALLGIRILLVATLDMPERISSRLVAG